MRILLVSTLLWATCFGQGLEGTSGTWKMNAARSTFAGGSPFKSLTVRIERHPKGEVLTLDRIETDGRSTSSSTILYFDGEPRRFDDFGCSGIQSSRRADERTVEIVRKVASGERVVHEGKHYRVKGFRLTSPRDGDEPPRCNCRARRGIDQRGSGPPRGEQLEIQGQAVLEVELRVVHERRALATRKRACRCSPFQFPH